MRQFMKYLLHLFSFQIFVRLAFAYMEVQQISFGTQTTNCFSFSQYKWLDQSGAEIHDCDAICTNDFTSLAVSTLLIKDNSYKFSFTLPTQMYSIIGIDVTFISTHSSIKLKLQDDPFVTVPKIDIPPWYYDIGSMTCLSNPSIKSNVISAEVKTYVNIGNNSGELIVEKTVPTQVIGIRSIRIWVNCADNCLKCANMTYCSVCIAGFNRHTAMVNSVEVTVCEVIENCPTNCLQCYTLVGATTCTICVAGFYLQSNSCLPYSVSTPCTTGYYANSSGQCIQYTGNQFYYTRASQGTVLQSFTATNPALYQCPNGITLIVHDYYNFKLFRCGCAASTDCKTCTTSNTCLECKPGYYRDLLQQKCYSCTQKNCQNCLASGQGCPSCDIGYALDSNNVCWGDCNASWNCEVCTDPVLGPCTKCKTGYKMDLNGDCVSFTCKYGEQLNEVKNQCECFPGFKVDGSGLCSEQLPVFCAVNEYIDTVNNVCICRVGQSKNPTNNTCEVTPVCTGVHETFNVTSWKCECDDTYEKDASNVCVEKVVVKSDDTVIRASKISNGYTVVVYCKMNIVKYAGQNIEEVLTLRLESGLTEYKYQVKKIEGTNINIELIPNVTFKGEKAIINFKDTLFMTQNKLSSSDHSVDLSYYIVDSESQKSANEATSSVAEITVITILTTIIPIAIFSNFYVLINTIDLTAFLYYLLFVDVRYPSNVLTFYGFFQNFQFPFIPDLFLNIVSQDYTQEAAKPFKENATQRYFLSNSGQSISIVIYILAIYVVGKLFSYVSIPKVQSYLKRAMHETWEYSAFFDLLWSLYIYFLIGALLQFQTYDFEEENHVLNYTLHTIFGAIMILAPFIVTQILYQQKNLKSDSLFKVKFATLLGGLVLFDEGQEEQENGSVVNSEKSAGNAAEEEQAANESSESPKQLKLQMKLSKMYMGILYLRKLAFSIVLVFMTEFTYAQLFVFSVMNMGVFGYFIYIKPMESKWENIKNAVGEVVLIIVQICVVFLVEDTADDEEDRRYNIGWVIIGFSGFIMAWHTIQLVYEMVTSLYQSLRNLCKKKDTTQVQPINSEDQPLQEKPNNDETISLDQSMNASSHQPPYVSASAQQTRRNPSKNDSQNPSPQRKRRINNIFNKKPINDSESQVSAS